MPNAQSDDLLPRNRNESRSASLTSNRTLTGLAENGPFPSVFAGNELRDLITLKRIAVIRREIGQWPAVGVLDLDPHVAAGTNQAVDLQSSARISQDADKVVLAVQPRVRVPERGVLGIEIALGDQRMPSGDLKAKTVISPFTA